MSLLVTSTLTRNSACAIPARFSAKHWYRPWLLASALLITNRCSVIKTQEYSYISSKYSNSFSDIKLVRRHLSLVTVWHNCTHALWILQDFKLDFFFISDLSCWQRWRHIHGLTVWRNWTTLRNSTCPTWWPRTISCAELKSAATWSRS